MRYPARFSILFCFLFIFMPVAGWGGDIPLTTAPTVHFATVEEGRKALGARDDFIMRLTPWERMVRSGVDRTVSESEFLKSRAGAVRPWTAAEISTVTKAWEAMKPRLALLKAHLPERILMVKCASTTGSLERAISRGNTIVLTPDYFDRGHLRDDLRGALARELFHIITRRDPELRERLYELVDYVPCREVFLAEPFRSRQFIQPYYPVFDCMTTMTVNGKKVPVAPVSLDAITLDRVIPPKFQSMATTVTIRGVTRKVLFVGDRYPTWRRRPYENSRVYLIELQNVEGDWIVRWEHGGPVFVTPDKQPDGINGYRGEETPEEILARDFEVLVADPAKPARFIQAMTWEINSITSEALTKGTTPDAVSSATRSFEKDVTAIRKTNAQLNRVARMRELLAHPVRAGQ